jgi:hypothetical protein
MSNLSVPAQARRAYHLFGMHSVGERHHFTQCDVDRLETIIPDKKRFALLIGFARLNGCSHDERRSEWVQAGRRTAASNLTIEFRSAETPEEIVVSADS